MMRPPVIGILLLALLALGFISLGPTQALAQKAEKDSSKEAKATTHHWLLKGVETIKGRGTQGRLAVWGADATTLIAGKDDKGIYPIAAHAQYHKGWVLAFAHPGYTAGVKKASKDYQQLIRNAIKDCATKSPRIGYAGSAKGYDALAREYGATTATINDLKAKDALKETDLLIYGSKGNESEAEVDALDAFLRQGGRMIVGMAGWIWKGYWRPEGAELGRDCGINQLLFRCGLAYADGYSNELIPISKTPNQEELHARAAFRALQKGEKRSANAVNNSVGVIESFMRIAPADDSFYHRLRRELPAPPAISKKAQVSAKTPLKRLAVTAYLNSLESTPLDALTPAPGVELFPGSVAADAERVKESLSIDLSVPGRFSTGLYAAPAEVVEVKLKAKDAEKGLSLRIGAQSDSLYGFRNSWMRYPEISRTFALDQKEIQAANAFGGLIYLEVPSGLSGTLKFTLSGVVRAPSYTLGETSKKEWEKARQYPAPWAELGNDKVILTLPSRLVRDLEDPEALMKFWDGVRDMYEDLGQKPLKKRPERMVVDIQISNGYMHAGYPIMMQTYEAADKKLVDLKALKEDPRKNAWGLWHELGHNHQEKDWTFSNTTEVTVNIFSLFVCEQISGKPTKVDDKWRSQLDEYATKKKTWKDWGKKPFHGLLFYSLIIDEFGWKPIKEVFALYRDLPKDQRPKTDLEKRDQWLIHLSGVLGKNLTEHFEWFGVEVSKEAKNKVANLPTWLHEECKKRPRE